MDKEKNYYREKLFRFIGEEIIVVVSSGEGCCRFRGMLCYQNSEYILLIVNGKRVYIPKCCITSFQKVPITKVKACYRLCGMACTTCTDCSEDSFNIFMTLGINPQSTYKGALCYKFWQEQYQIRLLVNNAIGKIKRVDTRLNLKDKEVEAKIVGQGQVIVDSRISEICNFNLKLAIISSDYVDKLELKGIEIVSQSGVVIHGLKESVLLPGGCIKAVKCS